MVGSSTQFRVHQFGLIWLFEPKNWVKHHDGQLRLAHDLSGESMCGTSELQVYCKVITVQLLAPNDVISTRQQHSYLGYFGYIFYLG